MVQVLRLLVGAPPNFFGEKNTNSLPWVGCEKMMRFPVLQWGGNTFLLGWHDQSVRGVDQDWVGVGRWEKMGSQGKMCGFSTGWFWWLKQNYLWRRGAQWDVFIVVARLCPAMRHEGQGDGRCYVINIGKITVVYTLRHVIPKKNCWEYMEFKLKRAVSAW